MEKSKIYYGILNSYYGGMLNEHQKDVLRMYYDCDMSLSEIGDEMSITRQGVREVIVRCTKKLEEYESKLGLVGKIKNISNELSAIIKEENMSDSVKERLESVLSEIKEI